MPVGRPQGRTAGKNQSPPEVETDDTALVARLAGLRYVEDTSPGIRRRRAGRGFRYLGVDGAAIQNGEERARIKGIGIPPAWTDVWIAPSARGHIQATGRDARGRKQYRYHAHWCEVRDEAKYGRMLAFGEALPRIRERVEADLARPGLPREKVLATVVRLLDETLIRIGNQQYARENQSYGLTTMRDEHVDVVGSTMHFQFRGKSGKEQVLDVRDRRLALVVKHCQDLPGHVLFQYLDAERNQHGVESADVNAYLHEVSSKEFTAKDFRTWGGTVVALSSLGELGEFASESEAKQNVVTAVKAAAAQLGNTPAICRKCYVHPQVIDAYLEGVLGAILEELAGDQRITALRGLRPEEARVLALLERRQARGNGSEV